MSKSTVYIIALFSWLLISLPADAIPTAKRAHLKARIAKQYPEQLTNPQKKCRKTFSQFGYNLYEFVVPVFPITKFIGPHHFGTQSYSRPNRRAEKNGAIYTCRGGFIDFSHMRNAIDWTVYLSFTIVSSGKDMDLPWEAGDLHLHFANTDKLTEDDMLAIAQKIAYERLTWHEIASWHYHKPYHTVGEQQSTFTPEDTYSNLLGTEIGRRVAKRMLSDTTTLPYEEIATQEIAKMISSLQPMTTKEQSRQAYDLVDRNVQLKRPIGERNEDVWYDSKIVFHDQRYMFKRNLETGPVLKPWLVNGSEQLGCPLRENPQQLNVPQVTQAGVSLYNYYEFTIKPDPKMFYSKKHNRQLHPAFGAFATKNMDVIKEQIRQEMAATLREGFDKRNEADPTVYYSHLHHVFLK